MEPRYSLGILGLGVMGRSLARNFQRNGFEPIGYDVALRLPDGFPVRATDSLAELAAALQPPRTLLIMVPAGAPVDAIIATLQPYLQPGDLIIDGGNSYFSDTERRAKALASGGLLFIGMGVSGGERGALCGPSLMPGGPAEAWLRVRAMLEAVAARTESGEACVSWMGPGGAGHYVKMVHNGIEYGDMQLIAEVYDLLHRGAGLPNPVLAEVFSAWTTSELDSYLIAITAEILARVDEDSGQPLVDLILDEGAQKGTGKWASQNALDLGAPTPTINAAVESRLLSAQKAERVAAARILTGPASTPRADPEAVAALVRQAADALYTAKICSYAQGFALLRQASREYGYGLSLSEIARIWRGGCIIQARFLDDVRQAFASSPDLPNLLVAPAFAERMNARQAALRHLVSFGVAHGIPTLALSSALAYFDAYRSERLPANLTQAQRDYFGAHTYHRIDRDGVFHTRWTG
ncbi:MAG TPA: NADP-dependent phosphogluconate dehydrogenase [Anaerolineaceae bacterium]|nr:NADP-dependent phosphogluconate dehydrogenase [Anaerolineaceae bacterium]